VLLDQALASNDQAIRRFAVQAFGRMASPSLVDKIYPKLDDSVVAVRVAAANAVGQALSGLRSDLREPEPLTPEAVRAGRLRLVARLDKETDDDVVAMLVATIGRLRHDAADLAEVEALLVDRTAGSPVRLLGAAEGLEAFARRNPRRPLAEPARARLRDLSTLGRTSSGPAAATLVQLRRMAMTALQVARDTDTVTMLEAAADPDWQVRRIAAQMMNPAIDRLRPAVITLLDDPQMHVRIDAVRSFARGLQTIADCEPLLKAISDPAPLVSMQAMDSLSTRCSNQPALVAALIPIADRLADPAAPSAWHRPARALSALARLAPDQARSRLAAAEAHPAWQVRATAATVAGALNEESVALKLALIGPANVRTAAIDALVRLKHPQVSVLAIQALADNDHQLVRAAARALQGSSDADAVPSLMFTLRRLSATASDTSRDPRVAIVERLAELLGPDRIKALASWTGDWDTAVRAAATKAFVDAGLPVPEVPRQYRYPAQPTVADLRAHLAAKEADIELASGGVITIALRSDEAPMTVSRFVARAQAGAYDGLTFHRVVPNFVVQGLSPGANEYVGDTRFMRDEVGLPHIRGAVGISTRGYDTGDAQIFFDLIDVPRLNHDYTIFALVVSGLEHMDAILEGATVTHVTIR
jgi:cyclophilin family peptidyl-prolyl cis-trans isomerase/HEAT repeat protein